MFVDKIFVNIIECKFVFGGSIIHTNPERHIHFRKFLQGDGFGIVDKVEDTGELLPGGIMYVENGFAPESPGVVDRK